MSTSSRLRWFIIATMFRLATTQLLPVPLPVVAQLVQRIYARTGIPFREQRELNNLPILDSYDFVIVGAGPGGCVMANRLSENPDWSVLLLEAGIEGNIYTDVPALNFLFGGTNFNWKYLSEPQPELACRGLVNQTCPWPSGKGVGGATIWNVLLWTRSPPSDFDEWEAMGNPGWSYKNMLRNFLKVENMTIPELQNSPYHSTKGPVSVQYSYMSNATESFLQAGKELGYDSVDYNNPNTPTGFSRAQISASKGRRVNAAKAYLFPARNRPNLHIVKNAFVTKVIIDETSKTATGVEFIKDGRRRIVKATKETILSAGAFNTPKILMLSGVGPMEHLNSKNIQVVHDLPAVGQNLQEHVSPLITVLIDSPISYAVRKIAPIAISSFQEWLTNGTGLLTTTVAEAFGYVKTDPTLDKPNIELIFSPASINFDDGLIFGRYFGIADDTYKRTWGPINQRESFGMCAILMYPKSKGEVRLRSSTPDDPPVIIPNFLKEPEDVKTIIDASRLVERLLETPAMKKIGARLYREPIYRCEQFEFGSDEYYECAVRTVTLQFHHQCCTARMGPSPEDSVVTPRLKVHGVNGLRVVDASVMPKIPGVHLTAIVYAIAENAADMVKEDWTNEL